MKKLIGGLLTALLLPAGVACSQTVNFPQTLPPNTVVGRLGIGPGPAEAIPISSLASTISGTITCATELPCFTVAGAGFVPPDNISWPVSLARIGTTFTSVNNPGPAGDNQWGLIVQIDIPNVTGTTNSYEKAAIFAHCYTNDPSGVGGAPERGCVGIETRGEVKGTNGRGEVWGLVAGAYIQAGGDGNSWGIEIDAANNGTDQPTMFTDTSKYGIQAVAIGPPIGTNDSTAAYLIINGGKKFHKGFVANTNAITAPGADANASFIELMNIPGASLYRIRGDGVEFQLIPTSEVISVRECTVTGTTCAQRFGVAPSTGANNDEFDIQFQFTNSANAQYTGAKIRAIQTSAAGGGTTQLTWSATAAGVTSDVINLNTGAFFPQTSAVVASGGPTNRWAVTYSVYESTAVLTVATLATCNPTTEGWRAYVNNNAGVVFRAVAVNGGTDRVAVLCNGTNWLVD